MEAKCPGYEVGWSMKLLSHNGVSFMLVDTLANFHTSGTIPDFTEELKIPVTVGARS